ncbi:thiamine diphosphokinase [Lacticaseibacillus sp. GG6-2]
MRVNLLLGGPRENYPQGWQQFAGAWVGVDRGGLHLLQAGITPVMAVGDFDSLTASEHAQLTAAVANVHTAPAEKDETDTELGVRLAFETLQATEVVLVGATGGRLDHLLANLFLPTQPRFAAYTNRISLCDRQNLIHFYQPGAYRLTPRAQYRYLGIVPLTAMAHLNIHGAKYPLTDWSSATPFSWASNEFVGQTPVQIDWQAGVVAVIYSRDRVGQQVDN